MTDTNRPTGPHAPADSGTQYAAAGAQEQRERVFAPLPPARGRGFANTWWGRQWLQALEDTALDGQQLKAGRAYARKGAVGAVSVRPGRITAVVQDRNGAAYRADVLLQQLDEDSWVRLLDTAAGEAGHIAALLDRDMPPHLVEDAAHAGVELLPGIGDLDAECACDAWDHCVHTAALSYQTARLLDQDPFVLLLLRGKGEQAVLDGLQERSAAQAATTEDGPAGADGGGLPGVPADEAFALAVVLPPLPPPPPAVREPGAPPSLSGGTPPEPGVDPGALEFLIADTAARARRMLGDALAPGHANSTPAAELGVWQDAVRMAAARPGQPVSTRLAAGCGRTVGDLERAVRAWGHGGAGALAVLEGEWTPDAETMARAREQLAAAWADESVRPALRATRNRWTVVGTGRQLRLGRDGRWWPYRKERGGWWPAGGAEADPAAALVVATGPQDEDS